MPMYYDISASDTTSSTAGSQSTSCSAKFLTGTATACGIRGIYAAARGGTAGGGILRAITRTTAQTSAGNSYVLAKRNPNNPTAVTSAMTATTSALAVTGTTVVQRTAIGFAQTGGMGGWVAIEPDAEILLLSGGGAAGNCDFVTIANAASVTFDFTIEVAEK